MPLPTPDKSRYRTSAVLELHIYDNRVNQDLVTRRCVLFVRELDCSVLTLDESITADEFRMTVESRYFDAVTSEIDVIHLVPVEVRNEKQLGLSWLNEDSDFAFAVPHSLRFPQRVGNLKLSRHSVTAKPAA